MASQMMNLSWVRTYKLAVENQEAIVLLIALVELARMKN